MKKFFLHGLVAVLGCLVILGCATQTGQTIEADIWRDVNSSNDLEGKWEGYKIAFIPGDAENLIPESSIEMRITYEFIMGSREMNGAMYMDMDRFLTDWVNVEAIRDVGLTKDDLWELLVSELKNDETTIVGGKYLFYSDLSGEVEEFIVENPTGKLQINQNGTKLRMIFFEAVSMGLGDEGITEIIMTKK